MTIRQLESLLKEHDKDLQVVMLQEHTMGECTPLLAAEEHTTTKTPWGYVARGDTGEMMLVLKGRN